MNRSAWLAETRIADSSARSAAEGVGGTESVCSVEEGFAKKKPDRVAGDVAAGEGGSAGAFAMAGEAGTIASTGLPVAAGRAVWAGFAGRAAGGAGSAVAGSTLAGAAGRTIGAGFATTGTGLPVGAEDSGFAAVLPVGAEDWGCAVSEAALPVGAEDWGFGGGVGFVAGGVGFAAAGGALLADDSGAAAVGAALPVGAGDAGLAVGSLDFAASGSTGEVDPADGLEVGSAGEAGGWSGSAGGVANQSRVSSRGSITRLSSWIGRRSRTARDRGFKHESALAAARRSPAAVEWQVPDGRRPRDWPGSHPFAAGRRDSCCYAAEFLVTERNLVGRPSLTRTKGSGRVEEGRPAWSLSSCPQPGGDVGTVQP
jgi:hypothetical protein